MNTTDLSFEAKRHEHSEEMKIAWLMEGDGKELEAVCDIYESYGEYKEAIRPFTCALLDAYNMGRMQGRRDERNK